MITKTIRTPAIIQLLFILALLPWLIACTFMIWKASASPLDDYCSRQFEQSLRYKISPLAFKKCQTRFDIKTNEWVGFKINK